MVLCFLFIFHFFTLSVEQNHLLNLLLSFVLYGFILYKLWAILKIVLKSNIKWHAVL